MSCENKIVSKLFMIVSIIVFVVLDDKVETVIKLRLLMYLNDEYAI